MNTGETITVIHVGEGRSTIEAELFCDICGWADTVRRDGYPDDPYHFCHRHKADHVRDFMQGRLMGYFEGQKELL